MVRRQKNILESIGGIKRCAFLNRYGFAYPSRDTVNTAMKDLNKLRPDALNKLLIKWTGSHGEEFSKYLSMKDKR